ncbi:hypothetical protein [Roseovarius sp. 2305UL8-3]|uniref:hypothetical protein n=1 Tax=Roseovarius conchicola TaxID=3121636 RepID=UPI0035291369
MRFTQVIQSIFLVLAGLSCGPLWADANLNCDAYAAKAVFQNNHNNNIGCGFTGGRWSNNYEGHKAWCLSAGVQMQHLTAEDNARIGALAECQKIQGNACKAYATDAVRRAKQNAEMNCGFQDSAFDNNYDGHFKWCMSVHMNTAATETYNRNQQIGQCLAQKKQGICGFYVAAISPLYQRHNEACAGREDFQLIVSNPEFDRAECLKHANLDAAWANNQVAAMNDRIAICESNTVVYSPVGDRGVPLDACTNDLGAFCGKWVPDGFCKWKGHTHSISHVPSTRDFTVHLDCVTTGNVAAADQSQECYCKGTCGAITAITCTGRK